MTIWRLLNLGFAGAAIGCAAGALAGLVVFFPLAAGGWFFTLIPIAAQADADSRR